MNVARVHSPAAFYPCAYYAAEFVYHRLRLAESGMRVLSIHIRAFFTSMCHRKWASWTIRQVTVPVLNAVALDTTRTVVTAVFSSVLVKV